MQVLAKVCKSQVSEQLIRQDHIRTADYFWELLRSPGKQSHVREATTFNSLACGRQHRFRKVDCVHLFKFSRGKSSTDKHRNAYQVMCLWREAPPQAQTRISETIAPSNTGARHPFFQSNTCG
jgi:hypothetical protein